MWVLEISKNGRELMRSSVQQPTVLIGRSPACDVVLRFPGIKPVHFLLEWIGEGTPVPGSDDWSLLDIYQGESAGLGIAGTGDVEADAASEQGSGVGASLSKEYCDIAGFQFRWIFDPLAETHLQKGALSARLKQNREGEDDAGFSFHSSSQVLEIVTVDSEREKVSDIHHIKLVNHKAGYHPLALLPQVLVHSPNESRAQISLENMPEARAFLRGYPVRHDDLKETMLGPNDLLQIRWTPNDYYLRLVPEVIAPKTPKQIWKDPFYIWSVGSLFVLALVIAIVSRIPMIDEDKEVVPPRIAQLQIREAPIVNMPAPDEPAPETLVESQPEPAAPVTRNTPAPQAGPPKAEVVEPAKKEPAKKPVMPAKKEPVTKMGLLANLRNSNKTPQVRADKVLNQGIVSETASGAASSFVVKQPPPGSIGKKDKAGDNLAAASSEVKTGDKGEVNSLGAMKGGESGNLNSMRYGSATAAANAAANASNDSVTGGLDRDSVRRTLRTYQKEVRNCYEKALLVKPKIQGRIVYQWTITSAGQTTALRLTRSQVAVPTLEKCVHEVLLSVKWPKAANGQSTIVNYPFEFQTRN